MNIPGLSSRTSDIFNKIKDSDLLSEYLLIGGTALSMQLQNRLSEDLDFCKWQDDPMTISKEINWPQIEKYLKQLGVVKTEIFDLFQVNFLLDQVKISFYSNSITTYREIDKGPRFSNITLASPESIGTMKLEVLSRRNLFRDYYDIYSILKEGFSLRELVLKSGRYSFHRMTSKTILGLISNGNLFKKEENFSLLEPKYKVTSDDIQKYIREIINKEFGGH